MSRVITSPFVVMRAMGSNLCHALPSTVDRHPRENGFMNHAATAVDTQCINTIRTLAMDAVQKANSGHPGTPMGLAPVGYTLWSRFLRYHHQHPDWPNRDHFVLSVGHASMLLYSLLHLAGVVEIDAQANAPASRQSAWTISSSSG